jgi:hypothetical protein
MKTKAIYFLFFLSFSSLFAQNLALQKSQPPVALEATIKALLPWTEINQHAGKVIGTIRSF